MAVCTKCGAILNNADKERHECRAEDIPQPGKIKIVTYLEGI